MRAATSASSSDKPRQGQTQGRGCVTDGLVSLGPVVRLRGVLVAAMTAHLDGPRLPRGNMISGIRVQRLAIIILPPVEVSVECLYYSEGKSQSTALVFQNKCRFAEKLYLLDEGMGMLYNII